MKFEIKKSYKESIQSFPATFKNLAKALSINVIAIMEDPRERYRAFSKKLIQLQHLKGPFWRITKNIKINYILNRSGNDNDRIEINKNFAIKINFCWDKDVVIFLESAYSLIPETIPVRCNVEMTQIYRKNSSEFAPEFLQEGRGSDIFTFPNLEHNFGASRLYKECSILYGSDNSLEKYSIERKISFSHHWLLNILIIDDWFMPSLEGYNRHFVGLKTDHYSKLNAIEKLASKRKFIGRPDPRDDLFIMGMMFEENKFTKYFNKDESVLMTVEEFQELSSCISNFCISMPLSRRIRAKNNFQEV